ncbi:uncharacterized protein MYCFIDRAFT_43670 [Pseudocercospora fijiensis CIRAD86]|uniref:Fe2OG dioxygenase domain-containing protein n=1 Tax=Pseudocercospora fijiensis (strain CIRAD86) TaxID=383855 RepID=M2YM74_PSEFD|nr:uncharacterized protein MYCFIDRAFT_43670 [Pseudocercospora fijiensis CIRAD86]EME78830.1 hypothetical protein MYCFIDRAFT_43670 [Pseudocercospora fijiensis CIRAD86]
MPARLETLSFTKLLSGDKAEMGRLLVSCQTDGFYYLDLRDWKDGQFVRLLDSLNRIMNEWFKLPLEEKEKAVALSDAQGYKPLGQQSGPIEKTRDGYESLRVSRTQLLDGEPLSAVLSDNLADFRMLLDQSHYITMSILGWLSDALQVPVPERFENYHPDDGTSRSAFDFIHHPPKPDHGGMGHNMHTDLGLLTLLFNQQPGLQVITPQTNEWQYVTPRHGFAVMNVGDTLMMASQDRLRSALHRVYPMGGTMKEHRYSTAYFLRPSDSATVKDLEGNIVTAEEWFKRKFKSFTMNLEEQRNDSLAFGGIDRTLKIKV